MKKKLALLLACFIAFAGMATAQVTKVTGTVIFDDDKSPVIGASVFVKGTTVGTTTDLDGKFSIPNVPADAKTITISFIGMQTEEVPVRPVIDVALKAGTETIEEAVVQVAYGAAKKSSLTGAVASVNSDVIESRVTSDVTNVIEGTVAGVQVNSSYGAPGTDAEIRIRGFGTVNGDATPLYVVDGVPFDGESTELNPADIESVTVLKDAASAALYGNRASNGVILITTKQGTPGNTQIRLNISQGIYARGMEDYDTVTTDQWMELRWRNLRDYQMLSKGQDATTAAAYTNSYLIEDHMKINIYNKPLEELFDLNGKLTEGSSILPGYVDDLDWYKEGFRIGWRQEYTFRASSGNDKSDYFFSLGYLDEQGYVNNAGFNRLTARASANIKPYKWMKTGLNLSGVLTNTDNTSGNEAVGDAGTSYNNYYSICRNIAPIYPVHQHDPDTGEYIYDADGNKIFNTGYYTDSDGNTHVVRKQYENRNVIWENAINQDQTAKTSVNGTAYVDLYFLKDFTFTLKGNLNIRNSSRQVYYSPEVGTAKGLGQARRTDYIYNKYTLQEQLRWARQFGAHDVSVLLGHENYDYTSNYYYAAKTGEIISGKTYFKNFTNTAACTSYSTYYRTESYLSRVRYNYQNTYNLEASFRRDGSSRFSQSARWGNFWSIGANWMISHEDFMRDVDWVNSLKLRADYGEVGNDKGASYYGYMSLYTLSQNDGDGAYYFSQRGNEDLQWETGQSWGVAIEAKLFKRWDLNIEYFDKRNKNLVFDVYQPLSAGGTSTSALESVITKNIGTIANRGVEIETNIDIIKSRKFKFSLGANLTLLKNTVLSLPEQDKDGISTFSGRQRIQEGRPLYSWYLYQWVGVDQMDGRSLYKFNDDDYCITDNAASTGEVLFGTPYYNSDNVITNILSTSNYRIINGEPYVTSYTYAKKDYSGNAHPWAYGSFSPTFKYKNWTLSTLITYSLGGKVLDQVYYYLRSAGSSSMHNLHVDCLKAWTEVPDGMTEDSPDRIDPNGVFRFTSYITSNSGYFGSTQWLKDMSYCIIKNAKLSYSLPKKIYKQLGMKGVTASITAENIATFSALKGMNPQQSFTGFHTNTLIAPRIITFDLGLKF